MLLTITHSGDHAGDLSFLLHKHPDKVQTFSLSFGSAVVFYPHVAETECTACLMLDVDPIGLVRRRHKDQSFLLGQYVNDRPYVASSLMSVAIAQVFGTAMAGRCKGREQIVETALPFSIRLDVLPVRGDSQFINRIFEPLGYDVQAQRYALDATYPEWGDSSYYSVTLSATTTLSKLLTHLYVLIPVFDNSKHYYVGDDELEKLLAKGEDWLAEHPAKEQIARRYLRHQGGLTRQALERLQTSDGSSVDEDETQHATAISDETQLTLNEQRHNTVVAALRSTGGHSVLDLGCGEGKLLQKLLKHSQFQQIVGVDVSIRALEIARKRLKPERMPDRQASRIQLLHGSLMYRDRRFEGFDAAAVVEVIEHLDPPRLTAFERVLFEYAKPRTIVLTTPNAEYNVMWETLPAGQFRHSDHRFEWTRAEFQDWANRMAEGYGYSVRFAPVGPEDEQVGSPTQMGVFELE